MKRFKIDIPDEFKMTEEERENILNPKRTCEICNDLHYIIDSNGKAIRCKCKLKDDILLNMKNSGMHSLLNNKVSDFEVTNDWQKKVKTLAIDYATNINDKWFVLLGQSGSGKTMICSAISNKFLNDGLIVNYIQWDSFIRSYKNKLIINDTKIFDDIKSVSILYIDDLFKGKISDFDLEICFELINYRYANNLKTIISSEFLFTELNDLDSAIAGRIFEKCKGYICEISKDNKNNFRLKNIY